MHGQALKIPRGIFLSPVPVILNSLEITHHIKDIEQNGGTIPAIYNPQRGTAMDFSSLFFEDVSSL
jgi:hypothetical protein